MALEGIRVIVEVVVWSCAVRNGDLMEWIDATRLQKLPQSFNMLLLNLVTVSKNNIDTDSVSSIIHRIASIYGAVLFLQGD